MSLFKLYRFCLISLFSGIFITTSSLFASAQTHNIYVFGNSLVHHQSADQATSVPYWLAQIAKTSGQDMTIAGQWGFLRNFAHDLPPKAQWSFSTQSKTPNAKSFRTQDYATILINPANFIQYQPATSPYDGENPDNISPLQAALSLIDWAHDNAPNARFMLYEGWADMAEISESFPPTDTAFQTYQQLNQADYHDWYVDFVAQLKTARPDLNITLIPVASTLAQQLTQAPLNTLTPSDLYLDNAPHGTANLYFLASLITYQAIFGVPTSTPTPASLHKTIRENYASLTPSPKTRSAPALSMGLDGVADWSAQNPFIDVMKSARGWTGHIKGKWGGWDAAKLQDQGFLDENGWLKSIPDDVSHVEAFILSDQHKKAISLAGKYRLTYKGQGDISVGGRAKTLSHQDGEIWFSYTPGPDTVGISIKKTDPNQTNDYIRGIKIIHESNIYLDEIGHIFNKNWTNRIEGLRSVRFMDWMFTNGSPQKIWADRPTVSDYTYTHRGVPLEVMVTLANELRFDPWFNMPHMATDEYSHAFARYVQQNLHPDLKAYVEYSNEVWNFMFPQAQWVRDQAFEHWGNDAGGDAWMQYAGMKAANVARIWGQVFAGDTHRLIRVVATHSGWPGLEQALLEAPLWGTQDPENYKRPADYFDAYAVTAYFGHELGTDEYAPALRDKITQNMQSVTAQATAKGLGRIALKEYVSKHQFEAVFGHAAELLRKGSLHELTAELFPYHGKVAKDYGLDLVMYEGGTHVVGHEAWTNDETLSDFFNAFNYSDDMGAIYRELLVGWTAAGGTSFNAFVDVARASKWGSWGALRHLDDQNPRFDALQSYNTAGTSWSDRPASLFDNGQFFTGSDADDSLVGTPFADVFTGGNGDDIFTSAGGSDKIHGGAGYDIAKLQGLASDYQFEADGQLIFAKSVTTTLHLYAVEVLEFEDGTRKKLVLE